MSPKGKQAEAYAERYAEATEIILRALSTQLLYTPEIDRLVSHIYNSSDRHLRRLLDEGKVCRRLTAERSNSRSTAIWGLSNAHLAQ